MREFSHPAMDRSPLPNDLFTALETLIKFYKTNVPEARRDGYMIAARHLIRGAYIAAHSGMDIEFGVALLWIYAVPEDIVSDVQAADSNALILLAYFAALLSVLESRYWFIKGWPRFLFSTIDAHFTTDDKDDSARGMLDWPRKQVFEVYGSR